MFFSITYKDAFNSDDNWLQELKFNAENDDQNANFSGKKEDRHKI